MAAVRQVEARSSNWLTRGVGGLAGARPALPNMAGGKGGAKAEQVVGPNVGLPGQPAPQRAGDTDITVHAEDSKTGDGIAREIGWHQQQTNAGPGVG